MSKVFTRSRSEAIGHSNDNQAASLLLKPALQRIAHSAAVFLGQGLLLAMVPLVIYLDLAVLELGMSEGNLTESLQALLLLLVTAHFYRAAAWLEDARPFLVLVGGFTLCMLIREQDGFLDAIRHGFWAYPVALVAIGSLFYGWRAGLGAVVRPMAAYIGSRSYYYLGFGLLLVLVFSRLFGSGHMFWVYIPELDNSGHIKSIVQEGLELAGYIFMFLSSVLLLRDGSESFNESYLDASHRP